MNQEAERNERGGIFYKVTTPCSTFGPRTDDLGSGNYVRCALFIKLRSLKKAGETVRSPTPIRVVRTR